jgi:hypothetical protein
MLVIRSAQMAVFKKAALRSFENEMVAHLAEFSPPLFKAVGEEQMRQAIQFGRGRAESYGFTFRGPVRLYLDLMLLFGSHFDTDPQYPWAAEILTDRDSGPQMQRAERLHEKTMDYRQKVAGPEDAYTLKALRNIQALARQPLEFSPEGFVPGLLGEIKRIYPQKAAYVGDQGLETLIHKGIGGARKQRFTTGRGVALVVVLMLAFGHGCGADPLYPWIARTLRDERITDPEAKVKRLETKALTWLQHVLAYFDKEAHA